MAAHRLAPTLTWATHRIVRQTVAIGRHRATRQIVAERRKVLAGRIILARRRIARAKLRAETGQTAQSGHTLTRTARPAARALRPIVAMLLQVPPSGTSSRRGLTRQRTTEATARRTRTRIARTQHRPRIAIGHRTPTAVAFMSRPPVRATTIVSRLIARHIQIVAALTRRLRVPTLRLAAATPGRRVRIRHRV